MPLEPPTDAEAIKNWLRELKAASGLSFPQLAQAVGAHHRDVTRWLPDEGEITIPYGDSMLRLLSALGVTFNPPTPGTVQAINAKLEELRGLLDETQELIRTARDEAGRERLSLGRRLKQLEGAVERQGGHTTEILEGLVADVEQILARLDDEGGQANRRKAR